MKKTIASYRQGGFHTLTESMDYAAQSASKVRFFDHQAEIITEHNYEELRLYALKMAAHLISTGIKCGSYIAIIAQTRVEFNALFFACQYAGLVPSPLPFTILPAGREAYEQKLCQFVNVLKPALLVCPASIEPVAASVEKTCKVPFTTFETLSSATSTTPPLENYQQTCLKANELAYIQFSSGSTANPSGLLITQQALMANLNLIASAGNSVIENEQTFSWLPFDHNMGLVSFVLSPVNTQSHTDFIAPATFMGKPGLWLELLSTCRSTLTFAPAFAYNLAIQNYDPSKHLDLSALRIAGIGGDIIHVSTLRTFAQTMKDTGFRYEAFSTGYGLTEAVMAVANTRPGIAPLIYTLSDGKQTQEIVSSGTLLPGFKSKFKNKTLINTTNQAQNKKNDMPSVGELWLKGPSIVTQSLNAAEKLKQDEEGYICTGDLGFIHEGHLFITGRSKDIIIIRGKNIWAQDVEWAVMGCSEKLGKHSVAAVGITQNNEEHLIVLIQNENFDNTTRAELNTQILQTINQTFGVKAQVVWTQPGQLSTTSVGKLARAQIKQNYIDGNIELITVIP